MPNRSNLEGRTINHWIVVEYSGSRMWKCYCLRCGQMQDVKADSLIEGRNGHCEGCGGHHSITHGHTSGLNKSTPTYRSWKCMWDRCTLKSSRSYNNYGARGIVVCDRWSTFENFLADMGERPAGKTIGRKDGKLGYEPSNCQWETQDEQAANRRSNRFVILNGEKMTCAKAGREIGYAENVLALILRQRGFGKDEVPTLIPFGKAHGKPRWKAIRQEQPQ